MDDFYRDIADAERRALTPTEGVERYFDWERLRAEALVPLRAGCAARFRVYDWASGGGLGETLKLSPESIVVVEGVYSARPELADLVDVTILVESGVVERLRRRRERHDALEWEVRWDAAETVYFRDVRPRHTFDHIVSGEP